MCTARQRCLCRQNIAAGPTGFLPFSLDARTWPGPLDFLARARFFFPRRSHPDFAIGAGIDILSPQPMSNPPSGAIKIHMGGIGVDPARALHIGPTVSGPLRRRPRARASTAAIDLPRQVFLPLLEATARLPARPFVLPDRRSSKGNPRPNRPAQEPRADRRGPRLGFPRPSLRRLRMIDRRQILPPRGPGGFLPYANRDALRSARRPRLLPLALESRRGEPNAAACPGLPL